MSKVRIYGRRVGYGSHAQVTGGFVEVIRNAGLLAGVVALDEDVPDDAPQPGGALAPVAIYTGPLHAMGRMQQGSRHAARYVMVAPNSDQLPPRLVRGLDSLATEILVPSGWAREVVTAHTQVPVRVVPHGVAPGYQPQAAARATAQRNFARGAFDVVHFSSSERERKSTIPLIEAWSQLTASGALPSDATLRLVLDVEAMSRTLAWMAEQMGTGRTGLGNVRLMIRLNAPPEAMAAFLATQHVVCQPSRGEGFGLVPLEALACGVPVVATACTGHSEWFLPGLPGALPVETGPDGPIDDLDLANAPTVTPEAIAAALRTAYETWPALDTAAAVGAEAIQREWAWSHQLAPFVRHLASTT